LMRVPLSEKEKHTNGILARHCSTIDLTNSIITGKYGFVKCECASKNSQYFNFMEGFGSFLYPPCIIQLDFINYITSVIQNKDCFLSDDIVLSYYFQIKNIPIYMNNNNSPIPLPTFYPKAYDYSNNDALSRIDSNRHRRKYAMVINYLRAFYSTSPESYLDLLQVYSCDNKIRLGVNQDGGYVIADIFSDYDCYISAGIKNEESFSRDFIKKYNMNKSKCFGFDGTIDTYPYEYTTEINFIKKNIAAVENNSLTNLHPLINNYNNIFLKMDIEGCEYDWLLSLTENHLNRFAQIVIEFHGINDDSWNNTHSNKIKCFEKLKNTHYIVHAHANNDAATIMNIPHVIELTYVNKKFFEEAVPSLNKTIFPIDNLDFPNHNYANEISLFTYPFVSLQHIEYVSIGNSDTNIKIIPLSLNESNEYKFHIVRHRYQDRFSFKIENNNLIVQRLDMNIGWGHSHAVYIYYF